jgi:hypothetical protein
VSTPIALTALGRAEARSARCPLDRADALLRSAARYGAAWKRSLKDVSVQRGLPGQGQPGAQQQKEERMTDTGYRCRVHHNQPVTWRGTGCQECPPPGVKRPKQRRKPTENLTKEHYQ